MATALTVTLLPTGYSPQAIAPVFTPADVANGNSFTATGREILLVRNIDGAVTYHFTVVSTPDNPAGREGDLTSVAVVANGFQVTQMFPTSGWASAGIMTLTADNVKIEFAVLRVP